MKDAEGFGIHLESASDPNEADLIQRSRIRAIPKLSAPSSVFRASAGSSGTEYLEHILRPSKAFRSEGDNVRPDDHTGFIDFSALHEFGDHKMPSNNTQWNGFFSSPQFYVVSATLVVLVAGASMYSSLNNKIDQSRLETKGDTQLMELRTDGKLEKLDTRFDKIEVKFDKIDSRFDALINKIDTDNKELRTLLREPKT